MSTADEAGDYLRESYFDGDSGTLSADVRAVIVTLMSRRILLGRKDPRTWDTFISNEIAVTSHFHNMYIDLFVDRSAQLVFKSQIHPEGVDYRVLLREQRATREMSTAMLYLRSEYNRQIHSGADRVMVSRADLTSEIETFWPETETNRRARGRNADAAIRRLAEQDLLIGRKDGSEWEVSPAIQVLFSAEAITRLTDWLTDPNRELNGSDTDEDDSEVAP
jgi:hypothetical protein